MITLHPYSPVHYGVPTSVWRVSTCGQGGTAIAHRVDVKQAAEKLGISSEGVRQRIRRGTLPSEKDTDDVLTRLEGEVEFLRQELASRDAEIQRRDAILLSLSEGLKAINPPDERGEPVSRSEGNGGGTAPDDDQDRQKPSWFKRFFGL